MDGELYDRALKAVADLLAEVEALESTPVPVPQNLVDAAVQRDKMVAAMKRADELFGPGSRDKLAAAYKEATAEGRYPEEVEGPKAVEEVTERAAAVLEDARRETIFATWFREYR